VFNTNGVLYPDNVVETDSHNYDRWGVGGKEAEAAMLGGGMEVLQPRGWGRRGQGGWGGGRVARKVGEEKRRHNRIHTWTHVVTTSITY